MTMDIRDMAKQLFSLLLPFTVLVVIPFLIERDFEIPLMGSQGLLPILQSVVGLALMAAGLAGIAWTVGLFAFIGKGTLAPWSPPGRLVVAGPYAYVRNPMITSVIVVLLGEAIFFGSWPILAWTIFAFLLNHFYFIFSEEPGLSKRFGEEYEAYKKNVPRWVPRLKPWKPVGS